MQLTIPNPAFLIAPIIALVSGLAAGQQSEPVDATSLQPTAANFEAWRDRILPCDDELNWQNIPWLVSFADGIVAANSADKPLLLWTMNGHPLGCT